jgi:hypothetical protein
LGNPIGGGGIAPRGKFVNCSGVGMLKGSDSIPGGKPGGG